MIRPMRNEDLAQVEAVVNDAAQRYRGAIPADRWHDPYMPRGELEGEIAAGVSFWVWDDAGELLGVMGLQDVKDATLIRHAYVRTTRQRAGIGGELMRALLSRARGPLLVGTWAAAHWAIRFYEKHGFRLVTQEEKDRLLRTYWSIPQRQKEVSVVLRREAPR